MNKLFTKIATAFVGMAMAIGVGVAVADNREVAKVDAAVPNDVSVTFKSNGDSDATSATNSTGESAVGSYLSDGASAFGSVIASSQVYLAATGNGIRIGSSNNAGSLGLKFKTSGTYDYSQNVKSITLTGKRYGTNNYTVYLKTGNGGNSDTYANSTQVGSFTFSNNNTTCSIVKTYDVPTAVGSIWLGSSKRVYVTGVTITYEEPSSDPYVTLSRTGNGKVMLGKGGASTSVTGFNLDTNVANPVYKWEIVNPSQSEMATITGTTATPTMTVSKTGTLEVKVSVKQSGADDSTYVSCSTNLSLEVVAYGGTISWTGRNKTIFMEGAGFDFTETTISTTMNDGTSVNYNGDYSDLHLYTGNTEVDINNIDVEYCETSRNYKLYDSEHEAWSTAGSATLVYTPKATLELASSGSIDTIRPNQSIYLKPNIGTGWGNELSDTNPFSSNNAKVVVSTTGIATTAADATGTATITATLKNGNTATFDLTVDSTVIHTPEQIVTAVNESGISKGADYGASTQSYTIKGYYYKSDSKIFIADDPNNPSYKVQLYNCTNNTGVETNNFAVGSILTGSGKVTNYWSSNKQYVEINGGTIDGYLSPAVESFSITGASEVYLGENLTLGVGSFVPAGSPQTVTWEVDDTTNASITANGVFKATASGVYTVTATSTTVKEDTTSAYAQKEISVFELQEVVTTKKASPKTTYYVGQTVENDLFTSVIKYKCGETLNYKSEDVSSTIASVSYTYGNTSLTGGLFDTKNESGATLTVEDYLVTSLLYPDDDGEILVEPNNISVENVKVYDIEIDFDNTIIEPTKTSFKFGEAFTCNGNIHVVYKNGYGSRDIELNDENVLLDEPDMTKLGQQSLNVVIDDSEYTGDGALLIGSYKITVTNVGSSLVTPAFDVKNDVTNDYFEKDDMPDNWSHSGAGSDYASANEPYILKMDTNGDKIFCIFPNKGYTVASTISAELYVKTIGGSTASTFTVAALNESHEPIPTASIKHEDTNNTGTTQNVEKTVSAELSNSSGLKVYGIQFSFNKGSNIGVSGGRVQAAEAKLTDLISAQSSAMANYLSEFKTCQSGWEARNDVKTLVAEYNAMHNDAKTAFETLTITDYDWEKEAEYDLNNHTYGTGAPTRTGVSAIEKLKSMVSYYNSSLQPGETQLVLTTPGGDFTTNQANSSLGLFASNDSALATIIVIISMVSITALGGYFFIRKRKEQ